MTSTATPNLVIRRSRADDTAKLATSLLPEMKPEQVHNRWQEHQDGYREMLLAELEGEIVGTVSITGHSHQLPDALRLFALDVGPKFCRRGVGTALMEEVEQRARRKGLRRVNLEVAVDNSDAIRLYEWRGYERFGKPEIEFGKLSWIMVKEA